MNTFRRESLKFCLGFMAIAGVALAYAGLWSLRVGLQSNTLLISTLDQSIWFVCGLNLVGFAAAYFFKNRLPQISGWIMCLSEGTALFILINLHFDPHYLIGFIIPILFAVVLLELKQSILFICMVIGSSFLLFFLHFQAWNFFSQLAFPLILLISVSVLLELILSQLHSNLGWYYQRYRIALKNEQIIRENEIKLEMLVENLKDYKRYLSETNISLIQARDDAEQARKVKQNFVQNVSHELRTPLNLIIGFSETMVNTPQNYGEVNWTPDLCGDIECIYQNSQHLKALIDDILDMASLENKKYEVDLADTDLNSLIHEVVLITENAYRSKGLYLETELSPNIKRVRGDAIRLKQVIHNLLSNALKYTRNGGVKISTTIIDTNACVFVKDTGKGIPEEDIDKVFDAFFQVDKSNNREDYGTGLGLYISKQLIELHGGEMSISSELGEGTTVFFSVPLVQKNHK